MPALGPRLIVAGTHSGVGKTTVATGLMAALRRRGLVVAPAKVGPDFIDPGYHALATGRPGRNLDPWICGEKTVAALAGRAAANADVLVVEGVMGLFDGAADPRGPITALGPRRPVASTASVASLLGAPVVLVVDASALSGSVAALVHGYASWDPALALAGVVLNRVGSDSHEAMLRAALAPLGLPVLGVLRRDDGLRWRDRHLGLVPVAEDEAGLRRSVDALAGTVARRCDLDALLAVARSAPRRAVPRAGEARPSGRARVAVLGGRSFSFSYPDNLELLEQAGAEIVPFDPEIDDRLPPAVDALYAGGGFPEVFAARLAANRPLLDDVGRRVAGGLVTWAECGGLLWLARSLDGHRMAGAVPADTRMTDRLTLGYRRSRPLVDTPLAAAGTELRGHEFHYSTCEPGGDALEWRGREGGGRSGFASPTLMASYLHLHLAADPGLAERFVGTAAAGVRG
ncbi:MAG TPA: cobyrinate a,c-diamide synthase [Acidimicrobiales bacterium]|nr:cobyrinate a,c-diamide synthase [Acidimicrobiales bacterium]